MAITFCPEGVATTNNANYIWRQTSGVFSANLSGGTFAFFDVGATTNDAIYFGWDGAAFYNGGSFAHLRLDVDTAIAGTGLTGVWEYYSTQFTTWFLISEACTLTDDTNGLTTTGANRVKFGRLPFQSATSMTINSQRLGICVRFRLTGGTITGGGLHTSTAPRFYDGFIRITGYSSSVPATLEDVYNAMTANYPEVGMRKLTQENTNIVYGDAYEIPNAGFWLNTTDSWLHTENNFLKMGNGSYWYYGLIGTFWTDGLGFGNFGTNGSRFTYCCFSGTNWYYSSEYTKLYGTIVSPGRYMRTMGGTLRTGGIGSGYFGKTNGTYQSMNEYGVGQGYWTGTGAIKNCAMANPGITVTYPFISAFTIENLYIFSTSSGAHNGLFALYSNTSTPSYITGVTWQMNPNNVYLFAVNSMDSTQRYWKFLNPSPKFPTNNDGTIKFMFLSGSYYTLPWNIQEYYSTNIKVLDENGDPISGATVSMVDNTSTQAFSVTTDANGDIATQNVLRMHAYYSSGLVCNVKNPYVLTISKSGYETYISDITVESKTAETITLKTAYRQLLTLDGDLLHLTSPELGTSSGLLKI